ncbi:hypothetical protein PLICRDRAFT_442577, partial [Plicaturopsis crispa FD-325 SS-3]
PTRPRSEGHYKLSSCASAYANYFSTQKAPLRAISHSRAITTTLASSLVTHTHTQWTHTLSWTSRPRLSPHHHPQRPPTLPSTTSSI